MLSADKEDSIKKDGRRRNSMAFKHHAIHAILRE